MLSLLLKPFMHCLSFEMNRIYKLALHCIALLLLLYSLIDCNSFPFHFIQTLYSSCAKRQIRNTKRQCQSERRNAGYFIQKLTCLIDFVWVVHALSACSVVVATVWQLQILIYNSIETKSNLKTRSFNIMQTACEFVYLFAC